MKSKMTTNSQLSTTESKKQKPKQTKQTSRTGTESQKWRLYGGLSTGMGRREKVPGRSSIVSRHKVDRER